MQESSTNVTLTLYWTTSLLVCRCTPCVHVFFPPLLCFQGLRCHSFMWCFLSSPLSATQHNSGPLEVAQVIRYGGALSHSLQASSPLTLPLSSFVLSLALHGSVVPGHLPQLQPDADTGSAGYGSESPGSVKCHFIQRAMLLSLFFFAATLHFKVSCDVVEEDGCVSWSLVFILESFLNYVPSYWSFCSICKRQPHCLL